jgi:predicted metalloprotease
VVRRTIAALVSALTVVLCAACGSHEPIAGRATSMLFDPDRAGGLPAEQGDSGPKSGAPPPSRSAQNTDDGEIDLLALTAIDDIEEFWAQNYDRYLPRSFTPVATLISYDSTDPDSPDACGSSLYDFVNAFYCYGDDVMAWDRGQFMPVAAKYFGDMSVVGVMAHEYGHALQWMSGLVTRGTDSLVKEQQADCFAGSYLRWVAAGESPRFDLSTGDGLNHVLAGIIYTRDGLSTGPSEDEHGSALDRVSAFQMGFAGSPDQCAGIDDDEIAQRRGDLPQYLASDDDGDTETVDADVDEQMLDNLMTVLDDYFAMKDPPTIKYDAAACPDAEATDPASYCPATNTIDIDLPGLQKLGQSKDENQGVLLQGDNTALSVVVSRYALALQHERGVDIDTSLAAVRTACLTGAAQAAMTGSDAALRLSPGDTDEAVAGLLTNGMAASDVNGYVVPAGFTRIQGYRLGLSSDTDACFARFS